MGYKSIAEIIDERLARMKEEIFPMTGIEGFVPEEMIDESIEKEDDYVGWKAIESDISDQDILNLEKKVKCNSFLELMNFDCNRSNRFIEEVLNNR